MITGSVLVSHLEFMKWADEIVLGSLLKAPADKTSADLGNSFGSMLDTLNHVYAAELVWLQHARGRRCIGRGSSGPVHAPPMTGTNFACIATARALNPACRIGRSCCMW